jgi:hypothetical protein
VLTLVALPLFVLGYGSAIVGAVCWRGCRWTAAAFLVGWSRAHGPSKGQQIVQLKATIEAQEMRLSRFSG